MIIFLALAIVPLLELAIIISLISLIGIWPTVALLIAGVVIGALLLKREGGAAMRRLRQTRARGEAPTYEVADGALMGMAALLLLIPGLLTDILALLLIIAPSRKLISRRFLKVDTLHLKISQAGRPAYDVEGQVVEETLVLEEKAVN